MPAKMPPFTDIRDSSIAWHSRPTACSVPRAAWTERSSSGRSTRPTSRSRFAIAGAGWAPWRFRPTAGAWPPPTMATSGSGTLVPAKSFIGSPAPAVCSAASGLLSHPMDRFSPPAESAERSTSGIRPVGPSAAFCAAIPHRSSMPTFPPMALGSASRARTARSRFGTPPGPRFCGP